MLPEEVDDLRYTRTQLWIAACRHEITVVELYEKLAELRRLAGEAIYKVPRLGRR